MNKRKRVADMKHRHREKKLEERRKAAKTPAKTREGVRPR